jgi:hypothetical protein
MPAIRLRLLSTCSVSLLSELFQLSPYLLNQSVRENKAFSVELDSDFRYRHNTRNRKERCKKWYQSTLRGNCFQRQTHLQAYIPFENMAGESIWKLKYQINTQVSEPKPLTSLIQKPASGHNTKPVPSMSFPTFTLILSSHPLFGARHL